MKHSVKQIVKGNQVIALFMGYTHEGVTWSSPSSVKSAFTRWKYGDGGFDYHLSWNRLMPVIDKIEYLYATKTTLPRFEINSHRCYFSVGHPEAKKFTQWIASCYLETYEDRRFATKIEAAFDVCVRFIEWYNKQNKRKG